MATIPVQNAYVEATAGTQVQSVYTDANGKATVPFRMTRSQYEALARVVATSTKDGYYDGQGNLAALPAFDTAIAGKTSMQITMEKIVNSTFGLTPTSLAFIAAGETKSVTVSSPDNTWEIYSSDSRLFISKQSATTINVTCPANTSTSEITYDRIVIRRNDPDVGWQYRYVYVSQVGANETLNTVTFTGRVLTLASGTSAGLAGATVQLYLYVSTLSSHSLTGVYFQGEAQTNSNGDYSMGLDFSADQWASIIRNDTSIIMRYYADSHLERQILVVGSGLPDYNTVVANGYNFGDMTLQPDATPSKSIRIKGLVSDASTNAPISRYALPSVRLVSQTSGALFSAVSVSMYGDYVTEQTMSRADWNVFVSEGMRIITSASGYNTNPYLVPTANLPAFDDINGDITIPTISLTKI